MNCKQLFLIAFSFAIAILASHAQIVNIDNYQYELLSPTTCKLNQRLKPCQEVETLPDKIFYNERYYYVTELGEYYQSENSANIKEVVFPSTITKLNNSFQNCLGITHVELPEGITSISGAFKGCTGLTSVTLPTSLTSISGAFEDCTALTTLNLPKSIKYMDYAFSGCTSLQSIDLPERISSMNYAFSGCTSLQSFNMPEEATHMLYAFSGCTSLQSISLPKSFVWQNDNAEGAFQKCTGLKSVVIGNGQPIPKKCFSGCSSLQYVQMPTTITEFGESAFSGCGEFEITWPDSLKTIGDQAFSGSTPLNAKGKFLLPRSVKKIGQYAFSGTHFNDFLWLPDSLEEVGECAFHSNNNMPKRIIYGTKIPYKYRNSNRLPYNYYRTTVHMFDEIPIDLFDHPMYKNVSRKEHICLCNCSYYLSKNDEYRLYYDSNSSGDLESLAVKSYRENLILEEDVIWEKKSQRYLIMHCDGRNFPQNPQYNHIWIGAFALFQQELTSIVIPAYVEGIESYAFGYNPDIKIIYCMSNTPPSCSNNAFYDINKNLTTVKVPIGAAEAYQQAYGWKDFYIVESDFSEVGIDDITYKVPSKITSYYSIDGRKLEQPQKGVNIIVDENGQSRKVLMK